MQTIKLEPGERAADNTDRVTIHALPSGKFGFTGMMAIGEAKGEVVHVTAPNEFESFEEVLGAALQWAAAHSPDELYVEQPDA